MKRQQCCPAEKSRLSHDLLGASTTSDAAKGLHRYRRLQFVLRKMILK